MKKRKDLSLPSQARPDELPAAIQLRNFARLLLPIYELEFQQQLSSPNPSWMFLTVLERHMRELEEQDLAFEEIRRKYGIKGTVTVQKWVRKYGNGSRGKIIRVESPEEINELKRLKERVRRLESALADANIDLALERAFTELACERAGLEVEEFKKKAAGQLRTKH